MNEETNTPESTQAPATASELAASLDLGTPSTGADEPAAQTAVAEPARPDAHGWYWATGRRKTAVARVRIKPGNGDIKIQVSRKKMKSVDEYFSELRDRADVIAPLKATNTHGKLDVVCRVDGGGYMGQAQAIRLGVARALKKYDPSLESTLRDNDYLTRDPREVERKKYGQAGARRRFQFSKR